MAYEQRDNSGSLFENDKKATDKHPDFKGKAMIDGVMYWVSAWTKTSARGDFFSLSFQPIEEQQGDQRPAQQSTQRPGGYGAPATTPQRPQQVAAVRRPQRAEGQQNENGAQEQFDEDSIPFDLAGVA